MKNDPGAPEEVEPDTPIWRYMGVDRLVSLLHTGALWFTRIDCFDDGWEGHISDEALRSVNQPSLDPDVLRPIVEKLRVITFVNCWTMYESESAGLWNTFVKSSPGVVIRSTASRLETAVTSEEGGQVAKVRYLDYSTAVAIDAFNKRREFANELEVRAALYDSGQYVALMHGADREDLPQGLSLPVSLADLITELRVSPGAPTWFRSAIEGLLETYGLQVPVLPSEMDAQPPGRDSLRVTPSD